MGLTQADHNDLVAVKLLKDFIDWKMNGAIDKSSIESYEGLINKATDLNVKGVLRNNMLFFKNN